MTKKQVRLGFTLMASGRHPSGWRLPGARSDGAFDPAFIRDTAQTVERGKFDFYFIGDMVAGHPDAQLHSHNEVYRPEAFTTAAFVAACTTHTGIVATLNTTYSDPYTLARATAQLDHLSRGRAAWNIVTGKNERAALNFSRDKHWDNSLRYDWATEFVEITQQLWDSWEDNAFGTDKVKDPFVRSDKIRTINYRGKFFNVAGPLNIPRPVQGHIPILHAGTSDRSNEFGARFADLRFIALQEKKAAQKYYSDVKGLLAKYGRHPDDQTFVAGVTFYVAESRREAQSLYRRIQEIYDTPYQAEALSTALGIDLSGYKSDARISEVEGIAKPTTHATGAFVAHARDSFGEENLTLRDLHRFLRQGATHSLQPAQVGDPVGIADWIEEQIEDRVTDGFIVFPPYLPGPLDAFVDLVVPELQRRGRLRKEYTTDTFRGHLGLSRPDNIFTSRKAVVGE